MYIRPNTRIAFSLVELSIVLVILGLLVGGVLSGQSLIRASELRSVTTQYMQYVTAFGSFRDKYFGIPGDLKNASMIWGKDNAACPFSSGPAATPGTCDGNGNGVLDNAPGNSLTGDLYQVWKQLALAGLITGNYTGLSGVSAALQAVPLQNIPPGRIGNSGWFLYGWGVQNGAAGWWYAMDYGNGLSIGGVDHDWPFDPLFTTAEVWNIDTKIDDGKPGTGKMLGGNMRNCSTTGISTDFAAPYDLGRSDVTCAIIFPSVF